MDYDKICLHCMREKKQAGGVCEYCGNDSTSVVSQPHQLEPFTVLHGRYLLGRVLGEGGFGITYIALDLIEETRVAIKELFIAGKVSRNNTNTVLLDTSQKGWQFYYECKEKFLKEAYVLQELEDKSGIVSILDFFEENNTAYIVMEYLEGEDLRDYLKKKDGRISYQEAFSILRPVMKSMIQVNQAGIIHRDISPDNIRHMNNGRMKLIDFGSARQISDGSDTNSFVLVKRGYAPREQYQLNYKVGPWMDVYSMSATFYRCITGKSPKPSIDRVSDQDLETPSSFDVSIPENLETVLMKGLALLPENRYPDMWSLYQALKAVCMENAGGGEKKLTDNAYRWILVTVISIVLIIMMLVLFFTGRNG